MDTQSKYEVKNKQFDNWLDQVFAPVSESDLTPKKRAERRARADADDLLFAKIYFPQIFSRPWNDMHHWVASLKTGKYTLSGFPMSGKSALVYVGKACKHIAMGLGGIVNINARTMDISQERTAALVRLMMRNQVLIYDYNIKIQQDLKGYYIINNTYFIAGSYKVGLRNFVDEEFKRIKVQINDDLYNRGSVTSELDNERVTEFVTGEAWRQLEDVALSITMGNSISADCPIVRLKEINPDNHFSIPALDEKGKTTWPKYRTPKQWEKFRETVPYGVWMGEYMDQPCIQGEIIDPEWFRSVNVNLLEILTSLAAIDPSFGQSPTACDKAFVVGQLTSKKSGDMLVISDLYVRKESYEAFFDYAARSHEIFQWLTLLFENDFNQYEIAHPWYLRWSERRKKTLPVLRFSTKSLGTQYYGTDKDSRIFNLVMPLQTGQIVFTDDVMRSKDFERAKVQALSFGKAKTKLDFLDALATLFIMIYRYHQSGQFTSTKKRKFERIQEWIRGKSFQ